MKATEHMRTFSCTLPQDICFDKVNVSEAWNLCHTSVWHVVAV